jgi:hypothetical protein
MRWAMCSVASGLGKRVWCKFEGPKSEALSGLIEPLAVCNLSRDLESNNLRLLDAL